MEWNTSAIILARRIHRYMAITFWGLSMITMSVGMLFYINKLPVGEGDQYKYLIPLNIALMLGIAAIFELYYQHVKKKEDTLVYPNLNISEADFEQRIKNGERLMVLDNMVLDVSSFAYSHPGGQFLIDYNIGRDIGKFFYGSYILDGNNNDPSCDSHRNCHSNIARKIVNKLAVATLKKDAIRWDFSNKTNAVIFKIDHDASHHHNHFTRTF